MLERIERSPNCVAMVDTPRYVLRTGQQFRQDEHVFMDKIFVVQTRAFLAIVFCGLLCLHERFWSGPRPNARARVPAVERRPSGTAKARASYSLLYGRR